MPEAALQLVIPDSAREELLRRNLPKRGIAKSFADPVTGDQYVIAHRDDPLMAELLKARGAEGRGIPRRVSMALYNMGLYQGVKDIRMATSITHKVLRQMSRAPLVASVHEVILRESSNYWRTPRHDKDTGFEIPLRDKDQRMTPAAKKKAQWITNLLLHGGIVHEHPDTGEPAAWDGTYETQALPFFKANQALMRDSLTFDGAALRLEPGFNEKQYPIVFFYPEDAATIRLTEREVPQPAQKIHLVESLPQLYQPEIRRGDKPRVIKYVQQEPDTQKIIREFRWNELTYWVRNIRTDTYTNGYGYSELERLAEIVAGIASGISFNTEFFTANHIPPGFLQFNGAWNEDWLDDFRFEIQQNIGGQGKQWTLPLLLGDETSKAQYIQLRQNDKMDIMWDRWMQFCNNVVHGLYGVASEKDNWHSYGQQQGGLQEADPASRMEGSQNTGLRPRLRDHEALWDGLVKRIDPDFCFTYVRLDPENETQRDQAAQARMMSGLTLPSEERTITDREEIKDPLDQDLYARVLAACRKKKPELAEEDPEDFTDYVNRMYEQNDGEWCLWPTAPVNQAQLQVWQQERAPYFAKLQAKAQQEMGPPPEMPGQDGQEGAQGDEQTQGQLPPWSQQRALPAGQQGGQEEEQGDEQPDYMRHGFSDTDQGHSAPPGYAPFGKAVATPERVIEVVIRRETPRA